MLYWWSLSRDEVAFARTLNRVVETKPMLWPALGTFELLRRSLLSSGRILGAAVAVPAVACAMPGGASDAAGEWRAPLRHALAAKGASSGSEESSESIKALLRGFIIARNASAARAIVSEEGLSRADFERIAREILEEQQQVGTEDRLGPRYDIHTGKYSSLEVFVERLLSGR